MPFDRALLALALFTTPVAAEVSLTDATQGLDLVPCELSLLSCVTLPMPLDHRANDLSRSIDITFALSFAQVESRGILFYIVGGPGASGLASAESYLSALGEHLTDHVDIVFIDQRGTGPDHGLSCPLAQGVHDAADFRLDDPEAAKAAARAYAADCTAELNQPELLPYVASDQAIRDAEAFRQALGAPQIWLDGESYGTQFVQAYATAFPQAVRGVILDGVVDLSLDSAGFYRSFTIAAEAILTRTLAACDRLASCARDMGRPAARVHADLAARLRNGPIPVPHTLASGQVEQRALTLGLFEANSFFALYSPEGRAEFLRALAAAERGNFFPMLQLGYVNTYVDPDTQTGMEDPGWFGAAFFAITCTDYDLGPGTPDDRANRILDEARAHAAQAPRFLRAFVQERLACAYWPHQGPARRPAPYAGGDWPTLVLNSDADPITPASMAYAVLDSARNAYGVFFAGGPHVLWGRGSGCPDRIVERLLLDDALPPAREQYCAQDIIGHYEPLTLVDPAQAADPLAVAKAVNIELYHSIPLVMWDGIDPVTVACDFGGTLVATATYYGTDYRFNACRFWPDLTLLGTGNEVNLGEPDDALRLDLRVTGSHAGSLSYLHRLGDEAWSISGTWNGQPAVPPRLP